MLWDFKANPQHIQAHLTSLKFGDRPMLAPPSPALVIKSGPSKEYFDGYTELHKIGLPEGEGPLSSRFEHKEEKEK